MFSTYVLPISGIDFIRYVAFYSILSDFKQKPKVIYSASGGCLVSYMAMMSGFTKSIESWKISSDMFLDKLSPFTSRIVTYILNGSFYHRPNITEYIEKLFVPCKLQDVEIISGFYDCVKSVNVVNTNFSKENSSLNDVPSIGSTEIRYLNVSDMKVAIREVIGRIERTTNIPILLKPIGSEKAIDFGIVAPSPRILVNGNMDKSVYFSPISLENFHHTSEYETLFHNIVMQDIIQVRSMFDHEKIFKTLQEVLDFVNTKNRYCLLIFTNTKPKITIERFTWEDVRECVDLCKKTVQYKLFYS
jgi:hypothetical protein